jgi:hypothetical protein
MKKLCLILGLAGTLASPSVFAALQITLMDNGQNTPGPSNPSADLYSFSNGGEFRGVGNSDLDNIIDWNAYASSTKGTVTTANSGGSWGYGSGLAVNGNSYFQTFCTELFEEFSPGGQYTISTVGNNALDDGTGHPVPITWGVAYLYSKFASGSLNGYSYGYGSGRETTAGNLQVAIWYLLGEINTLSYNGANGTTFYNDAVAAATASSTTATSAANGAFGVADLTLGVPGAAQDQLVMVVPEATTMIAGALLLLPLGASALRAIRKPVLVSQK